MRMNAYRLLFALFLIVSANQCVAQVQGLISSPSSAQNKSLIEFLQTLDKDKTSQYVAYFCDLDGDGVPEAIVHLLSNEWCGSGGCNTVVLAQSGGSWRVVTNISITRLPIRVLADKSNGWRNLGVWVQGGGISRGYEAELRFDGRTYPTNPTVRPARRLAG